MLYEEADQVTRGDFSAGGKGTGGAQGYRSGGRPPSPGMAIARPLLYL